MTDTHPSETDPQTRPDPDRWRSRPNPHLHVGPTARPCPTCGARTGEPCLDRRGDEQDGFHRMRSARPKAPRPPAPSRSSPAGPRKAPRMSEAELGVEVAKLVRAAGARSMHVRRSRSGDRWETATSIPGWLDLVIWGPGCGVLFRELKSTRGTLTDDQAKVIAQLTAAGANAGCWWPSDLEDGTIARELGLDAEPPSSR